MPEPMARPSRAFRRTRMILRHVPQRQYCRPDASRARSLLRLLEISQIGRNLLLPGRHQVAVRAQHIVLLADLDVVVVLAAIVVAPERLLLVRLAPVGLVVRPGAGSGTGDCRGARLEEGGG